MTDRERLESIHRIARAALDADDILCRAILDASAGKAAPNELSMNRVEIFQALEHARLHVNRRAMQRVFCEGAYLEVKS